MSALNSVKRVALVSAMAGTLMYAGDSFSVHKNVIEPLFNNKPVEAGYLNPDCISIDKRINESGNSEGYIVYKNGEEIQELPILKSSSGLQIGRSDYWWGILSAAEKSRLTAEGWQQLGTEKKEELVTRDWGAFGVETRHGLVRGELEQALQSFYQQSSGQAGGSVQTGRQAEGGVSDEYLCGF